MFSIKDSMRRMISLTLATVLSATVFVGCSDQGSSGISGTSNTSDTSGTSESSDTSGTSESSNASNSTTTSVTTATTEALTPGIEDSVSIAGNTLFHWVEEPTGSTLAANTSDFLENAEQDVGETGNDYSLPVFSKDSMKYVHAGNLALPLTDNGEFANEKDEMLVRYVHEPDTATGGKIYIYRDGNTHVSQLDLTDGQKIIDRTDKFWQVLSDAEVPTDHASYVIENAVSDAVVIPDNAQVWYNGISTDVRANGQMIPLHVLTDDFVNILDYAPTDNGYAFNLYTGIGTVKVNAAKGDNWLFSYTLPEGCQLEQADIVMPAADMIEENSILYVSADVLTKVFNYFIFTFSSLDMGDGSTDDIAVIITDNQDILRSDKAAREEVNRKAQEEQAALEELIATPEQEEQAAKDKEDRQELADDTDAYTTDGIPLTTEGGLTEPAKPTKNYKLPDGAQLEFTGDASTAETTTLPDGCYWTPSAGYPNAFTDPAGNKWCNRDPESIPFAEQNRDNGYYDAAGDYHPSQYEIDTMAALEAASQERYANGPSGDGTSKMTEQDKEELDDLLASLLS